MLTAAALTATPQTQPDEEWALRLSRFVVNLCKAPAPEEHKIIKASLEELNDAYRRSFDYRDPRREYNFFIKGMVKSEDIQKRKLIIRISSYDLETIVHESMHYCVAYLFNDVTIYDQESVTQVLTREMLLSPVLQTFIRELGR